MRPPAWIATLALEEGDPVAARGAFIFPLSTADESNSVQLRARVIAVHAHIALLTADHDAAQNLIPRLRGTFSTYSTAMEYPAFVLAMGLEKFEGVRAAAVFVRWYMDHYRKDRWEPRAELRRYLALYDELNGDATADVAVDNVRASHCAAD